MFRLLLFIIVLIGLYLFLNPPLSVIADLPPFPAQVILDTRPGVSNYELQAVRRALSLTANVLEYEAGLELKHPVKVILVPDITAYYRVLTEEEKIDSNSALFQAGISSGTTREGHIVLNCGAVPNYNDLIFITAHEYTHQYQFETVCDWSRNNWLTEGMAEVIAAAVVGINQGNRRSIVNDYRRTWLIQLGKASPYLPGLKQLDYRQDWFQAFQEYHVLSYRYSALAVHNLADEQGLRALGDYIKQRNQGVSAEIAFERAFGRTLPMFFLGQDQWLKENTGGSAPTAKLLRAIPS